jgi:hypothetical protein
MQFTLQSEKPGILITEMITSQSSLLSKLLVASHHHKDGTQPFIKTSLNEECLGW